MANESSGTSVGKISLQIDLSQDLQGQINDAANKLSAGLQTSLEKGFNLDGMFDTFQNKFKSLMQSINSQLDSMRPRIKAIMQTMPENKSASMAEHEMPVYSIPPIKMPSFGNAKATNDIGGLKLQIDSLTKSLDLTNRMIEQQQTKLASLKETYAATFDTGRKNAIEGQMLSTEQRINSLISTSDRLGFKLSDLDAQFKALSDGTRSATAGIDTVNAKMHEASSTASKASVSHAAYDRTIKQMGLSTSMFGRILDRMLVRMVIFNLVIRQIENLTQFVGNALMTNQQFSNSLAQIRSNLEIAFIPIYQAALPAILTLMNFLAKATTYIAAFISALFGTTYQASAQTAKGLNVNIAKYQQLQKETAKWGGEASKAAKMVKGSLAGFDEINILPSQKDAGIKTPSLPTVNAPMPIVAPPIDTNQMSASMGKIQGLADKTKNILKAILPVIAGVGTAFLAFGIITKVTGWVKGLTMAFMGLGAAGPVVLATVVILGLAAAFIILYKTNKQFKEGVDAVVGSIKKALMPILDRLKKAFMDVWNNALVPFGGTLKDIWQTIIVPFIGVLRDILIVVLKVVISVLKDLWQNVIVPLASFVKDIFMKVLQDANEIWKAWKPAIQDIINILSKLWHDFLYPVVQFIGDIFIGVIHQAFTILGGVITGLGKTLSGILDFITGVFTGNWEKAWTGIKEILIGVWNIISSVVKGALNGIIAAINAFLNFWNKLHFKVPSVNIPLVGKVGGFDLGLSHIARIPYLATGGIINQPTLAMVGESGPEAVTPLSKNSEWLDSLASRINNNGNNDEIIKLLNIIIRILKSIDPSIVIDGTTFGKVSATCINKASRQAGKPLIIV